MHPLDTAWEGLKRDFEEAVSQSARAARHQLAYELNQVVRRLRSYQSEPEWVSAVLDGAANFSQQAAVFSVQDERACLKAQQGLELPSDLSFEVRSAGAFAGAMDSRDPVVALRTAAEVGPALSSSDPAARAHIFPVLNSQRVVALIFAADPDYLDVNALELIGGMASSVLERQSNSGLHTRISALINAKPESTIGSKPEATAGLNPEPTNGAGASPVRPKRPSLPAWADLSEEQRAIHIKAQRFSRVTIAEMQLARPEACRAGREQKNLYVFLKQEIDKARDTYRKQYMTIPSMVDYLHLELVKIAAEGDEARLGADYPGQLV